MKFFKTILLFSFFILIFTCNRQQNSSVKVNQDSVISTPALDNKLDKNISTIFQDRKNNYWFGSKKGVYKYDGKNLTLFTKKDGLCSHSILGIQEDKFGNIYFDTQDCISKFDGTNFTTLPVIENNSTQNHWKLESDDLWFRMGWDRKGPLRFDGKNLYQLEFPKPIQVDSFYAEFPNSTYNPFGIYWMYKDVNRNMWFGTASLGACRFDGESISWIYEKQLSRTPSGGDFGIRSIIEDKEGYFWICNTRYRFEMQPTFTEKNGTNYIDYKRENGIGKSGNKKPKDYLND